MAFFLQHHSHPDHVRFVGEHLNETGKGDVHKLLIVSASHVDILFLAIAFANHKRPDAMFDKMFNNAMALCMQVVIHFARPFVGQTIQPTRGTTFLFAQTTLELSAFFIENHTVSRYKRVKRAEIQNHLATDNINGI